MDEMKILNIGDYEFEIVDAAGRQRITALEEAGTGGEDGFSPIANVTQTSTGAHISITDKDGTTTADVSNGTATDAQVAAWLAAHPDATTTVQNNTISREKLAEDVVTNIDGLFHDVELAYANPTYTKATLNNDGTLNTSGNGCVTDLLPVFPDETLVLNNKLTSKVAYYAVGESFLSIVSMTTGLNEYTVPSTAHFARFQNVYANGEPKPLYVRRKNQPENKTFFDLIRSPLVQNPSIGFAGDSNTSGYGLASDDKSWANLFADALSSMTIFQYNANSRWVECVGLHHSGVNTNFLQYGEMSIWTDADEITFGYAQTYSSAWKWLIDGVESGTASSTTLALDGNLHKVTVQFTNGQLVGAYFQITKTITCTNTAVMGHGLGNMVLGTGNDWEFIMIGTNDRNKIINGLSAKFIEYVGKGTYIIPFPNHKSDSSYTYSQMQLYSSIAEAFKSLGYHIVNLANVNTFAFYDDTLYQDDKIHFNAKGHRIIANMVSGAMGLPLYLQES